MGKEFRCTERHDQSQHDTPSYWTNRGARSSHYEDRAGIDHLLALARVHETPDIFPILPIRVDWQYYHTSVPSQMKIICQNLLLGSPGFCPICGAPPRFLLDK